MSTRGRSGRGPATRDQNRRQTKAEKREQARIERDEIQRRMARRKKNRALGTGLVIGAVVIAILVVFMLPSGAELPSSGDLLAQADQAKATAACSDVQNPGYYGGAGPRDPNYQDQLHIGPGSQFPTMPPFDTYPSIPPTSGPHNGQTARAGVYDVSPPMDLVLHSLEHGAAVVWYDPDAPSDLIDQIRDFYGQKLTDEAVGQDRVIVAPYDYPDQGDAGRLPVGTQVALVAWHRLQTCGQPSLAAAYDFTSQFAYPGSSGRQYAGEAPEQGGTM